MTGWLRDAAVARDAAGLHRELRPRRADDDLLDLSGNDYLGLSRHPDVVAAGVAALRTWGAGATGSRLVSGTTAAHAQLESALATFAGAERALVFSSGYLANLGAVSTLVGRGDVVISDAHAHASLVDACRLSRAEVRVVPHAEPRAVEKELAAGGYRRALVVTDSVFSVDGDLAPLGDTYAVAQQHGALLLVDEAHALGVVGQGGRGAVAEAGLAGAAGLVVTATLSKSLGGQGGAVLAAASVIDHLVNTARTFIFDTGLAPASAATATAALGLLVADPGLAARACAAATRVADLAAGHGYDVVRPQGAVVSVVVGAAADAVRIAALLAEHGVRVGVFRPPSVPDGASRLRLAGRADLTTADLDQLDRALAAAARA